MREGFIVTYYESSPESPQYLKKTLQVLSKENFYLVLATHTPVPEEVQSLCDWCFYEKMNVVEDRRYSHGVAESNLLEHSLKHLREQGIEWTFKMSYDVELKDLSQIWEWRKARGYELVTCEWGESWVGTNSFYARVEFLLENVRFFKTVDEMFATNTLLENCWKWDLELRGLRERVYSYPHQTVMFGSNLIDVLWYDYGRTEFTFKDGMFWLSRSEPSQQKVAIYDYYTDLCIYNNPSLPIGPEPVWIAPYGDAHLRSHNGFYAEIGGRPEVRNTRVRDFREKHPLSRKWNVLKGRPDSPTLRDLEAWLQRPERERDESPWGLASSRKMLMGEPVCIVDPDLERRELMAAAYGPSSNISIVDK
jgi:hypothetical protein